VCACCLLATSGTKTLLGVFDDAPGRPLPRVVREFATLDYDGLAPMVAEFLRDAWIEAGAVTAATIGVAGPVKHRAAWLTNVPWRIDASELQHRLGSATSSSSTTSRRWPGPCRR